MLVHSCQCTGLGNCAFACGHFLGCVGTRAREIANPFLQGFFMLWEQRVTHVVLA